MRVVSLVPSVTETLLAWGVEPVAVTRFCEHPELLSVGGTKDPDIGAIVALAPDLVVMDDEENRRPDADALRAADVPIHVTHVRTLADVGPTIVALAEAVRVGSFSYLVLAPPRPPVVRRAFVPIWRRPWMTLNADTYGASVLQALGIETVYDDDPQRYPTVNLDDVAARRPDMVLAPSEPYPFRERHLPELREVAADVRLVDGQDLFWWGARTTAALKRLSVGLS